MSRLKIISGSAILCVWCLSIGKGVAVGDWGGAPYTTSVMLIFAGYLFGDGLLRRRYADDD